MGGVFSESMLVGGVFTSVSHAFGWSVHWSEPMLVGGVFTGVNPYFVGGVFAGVSPCLWVGCSLE